MQIHIDKKSSYYCYDTKKETHNWARQTTYLNNMVQKRK